MDQQESDEFEEEESGVDPREVLRFVLGAARKHWRMGLGIALGFAVLGVAASKLMPRTYEATTRVLVVQEALVAQVTGNNWQGGNTNPFRGASEAILSSANLKGIVRDADLATRWDQYRQPIFRFKDWLTGGAMAKSPPKERERILSGILETRLTVNIDQTTIEFGARWSDPTTAAKVAEVAKARFLAERLNQEQAVTKEVIRILEAEEKTAAATVSSRLAHLEELRRPPPTADGDEKKTTTVRHVSAIAPSRTTAAEAAPDPGAMMKLERVRQSIRDVQDPWQRRQTELRLQLTDLRASYGPKHPLVVHQESRIAEAETPPAELERLRADERDLLAEIESFAVAPIEGGDVAPTVTRTTVERARSRVGTPGIADNSPKLQAEQERLFTAIAKYNSISSRLDTAKLEVATTEIAFRYRYVVILEPEVPTKSLKPTLPIMVAVGGIFVGLLLGLLVGAVMELARGKVLAPFQVKQLGVPMLAEMSLRQAPRSPHET